MEVKPLRNRGYLKALKQIYQIMVNQELIKNYEEYLADVTDGDKVAAAILTLAGIQVEEKASRNAEEADVIPP
jgi:hypothetical protein